jgi:hypothetical protein
MKYFQARNLIQGDIFERKLSPQDAIPHTMLAGKEAGDTGY